MGFAHLRLGLIPIPLSYAHLQIQNRALLLMAHDEADGDESGGVLFGPADSEGYLGHWNEGLWRREPGAAIGADFRSEKQIIRSESFGRLPTRLIQRLFSGRIQFASNPPGGTGISTLSVVVPTGMAFPFSAFRPDRRCRWARVDRERAPRMWPRCDIRRSGPVHHSSP